MRLKPFKFLLISFLAGIFFLNCKPTEKVTKLPSCIDFKIETLKTEAIQNPPAQVWQWENQGNTFYYFNAACCDQFSTLYNDNCEIICAPDGGITGRGDGKCPEFPSNTSRTLIWKDERKNSK